jgi:hypothetical protein
MSDLRALRAFEPACAWLDDPPEPAPEAFSDRELGILADQGNFERARMILARRVVERPQDGRVYLDAIRTERCAAPQGEAWQAWLSRALSAGASVTAGLPALVPLRPLCAYLVRQSVGWDVLCRQADGRSARDLLRLRLQRQAIEDPAGALAAIEEPALISAAREDGELQGIALAVMVAGMFRQPARVLALAPEYGIELGVSEAAAAEPSPCPELLSLLRRAYASCAAWQAARDQAAPPEPLERFVRCSALVSAESGARMLAELRADLRARPREHLSFVDAAARASRAVPELLLKLLADEGSPGVPREASASQQAALERCAATATATVGLDPVLRGWLGLLALGLAAHAVAWAVASSVGVFVSGASVVALLSLTRSLDAALYRRHLRSPLLRVVTEQALPLELAARGLRASKLPRRARMAELCAGDVGLRVLAAVCADARGPQS